jgi:hypothetical protein
MSNDPSGGAAGHYDRLHLSIRSGGQSLLTDSGRFACQLRRESMENLCKNRRPLPILSHAFFLYGAGMTASWHPTEHSTGSEEPRGTQHAQLAPGCGSKEYMIAQAGF